MRYLVPIIGGSVGSVFGGAADKTHCSRVGDLTVCRVAGESDLTGSCELTVFLHVSQPVGEDMVNLAVSTGLKEANESSERAPDQVCDPTWKKDSSPALPGEIRTEKVDENRVSCYVGDIKYGEYSQTKAIQAKSTSVGRVLKSIRSLGAHREEMAKEEKVCAGVVSRRNAIEAHINQIVSIPRSCSINRVDTSQACIDQNALRLEPSRGACSILLLDLKGMTQIPPGILGSEISAVEAGNCLVGGPTDSLISREVDDMTGNGNVVVMTHKPKAKCFKSGRLFGVYEASNSGTVVGICEALWALRVRFDSLPKHPSLAGDCVEEFKPLGPSQYGRTCGDRAELVSASCDVIISHSLLLLTRMITDRDICTRALAWTESAADATSGESHVTCPASGSAQWVFSGRTLSDADAGRVCGFTSNLLSEARRLASGN